MVKRDLGRVLLACERLADEAVTAAQAPQDEPEPMSEADRAAALALLRDPDLADRIIADFGAGRGWSARRPTALVGYLAAVSRKLDRPLAVIVQSTSAAGKSALMDAVLAFVPGRGPGAVLGDDRPVACSTWARPTWRTRCWPSPRRKAPSGPPTRLKLLSSDGELSIASTGKDTASGRLVTHTYR